jgi:hypothetical protein
MIVALFLPWYSVAGTKLTAWQAMAVDDVILFVAGVLAVAAALAVAATRLSGFSVAATSLAILPAAVGVIVTIYRLASPAPPQAASLEVGAWLGLVGALGVAVGAWSGASDEGPARRDPQLERQAAEEAVAKTELLPLNAPLQK